MMERLLAVDCEQRYTALTATPDAPARRMYEHLGWNQVGTVRFTEDGPLFDQLAMALPLPSHAA